MIRLLLILPIFLLASCVTAADIREISDRIYDFEEVLEDEYATQGEVAESFGAIGKTVDAVVKRVEDRGENFLTGAQAAGGGGLLSLFTGIGITMYRNSQRRKRGEPTNQAEADAMRSRVEMERRDDDARRERTALVEALAAARRVEVPV